MINLYRRYRPLRLSDVVGQEQVTKPLINSLKQGKVSHAYLFIGPRGCGKTSVARILAHEVNGFKYELEDDYVDIIEIDGASNRGIDNIRELREKVTIAPTSGKYKVYIVDEVHMLTKEAFNALLKTLEEPPSHVIFIMATTDAHKVPITITSRAQTYTFKLAGEVEMFEYLKSISEKEKIDIDDEALKIIVKRGGGSFRDSLSLLDQISTLSDDMITKGIVISALGLPEDEKVRELLDNYIAGNVEGITSSLKELWLFGIKPETLVEELISSIISNPRPELLKLLSKLPEVKAPFAEAKLLVSFTSDLEGKPNYANKKPEQTKVMPEKRKVEQDKEVSRRETVSNSPVIEPLKVERSQISNNEVPSDFDWNEFLSRVKDLNEAVYSQLLKTSHEIVGNELKIYPEKKIVKNILSRENNKKILVQAGGNVKITICELNETPSNKKNDKLLSKISDIMGGEVKNDGGGSPF